MWGGNVAVNLFGTPCIISNFETFSWEPDITGPENSTGKINI
jgi:hypothetical protein